MTQFLAVFVRSMLQDLQFGDHRRIKLHLHSKIDTVRDSGEPHGTSQVVRLGASIAKPFEGSYFRLRERCEQTDLDNISCAYVRYLKFTLFLDLFPLFRVDMV